MKYLVPILIVLLLSTYSCKQVDETPIVEGGCMGEYYIKNNSSKDLYITTSFIPHQEAPILVPTSQSRQYAYVAGFNDYAEPVHNFNLIELFKKDSDSLVLVYRKIIETDSFWSSKQKDTDPGVRCTWIYECEVYDSMLN